MANIDEELRLAREARAAIEKRPEEILEILRTAALVTRTRQRTMMFLSQGALNRARRKVGGALENLIPALEVHRETPTRMKKAQVAVDVWIKEIKAKRTWSTTDDD
jgi:hypothetical protein